MFIKAFRDKPDPSGVQEAQDASASPGPQHTHSTGGKKWPGFNRIVSDFFADAKSSAPTRDGFLDHASSDLLVYRSYDPKTRFFHNERDWGFMIEVAPQGNHGERAESLLTVLNQTLTPNHTIQFLNWAGPDIGPKLSKWAMGRKFRGGIVDMLTERRREKLLSLRFGDDSTIPLVPHNRRTFVCVTDQDECTPVSAGKMENIRRELINCFGGPKAILECNAEDMLELLEQLLHTNAAGGAHTRRYNEDEFLNYQLPGSSISVFKDSLRLSGKPQMRVASDVITRFPEQWVARLNAMLCGEESQPASRPTGPVLTCFTARPVKPMAAKSKITKKLTGSMSKVGTSLEKFTPDGPGTIAELQEINTSLDQGSRLFDTAYCINAYAQEQYFENDALAKLSSVYRKMGFHTSGDDYLALPVFLASLPFGMTDGWFDDFRRGQRMYPHMGEGVATLAPVMGEYAGTPRFSGMPLIGRQNALMNWSPFDSSGNYNTSVVGKSGAGKSVFMQDLSLSLFAERGRVIVVDDGRSFEGLCHAVGGDFIAFGADELVELNPFALVDASRMGGGEYYEDAIEMITNIFGTMCSLDTDYKTSRVEGIEEGFLGEAVKHAWAAKQAKATAQDVHDYLSSDAKLSADPRVADMLTKLARFTGQGEYARYFDKGATLSIDSEFVVFEMAELKTKKVMLELIMQMIMFLATEVMFKSDRSTRTALVIDEAWAILGGKASANFVEGLVRRVRKYNGCIICGTQSVDDYFNNPAAKVIFENSDNFVCLQQKPEAIDRLNKESKIDVSGHIAQSLKSLAKVPGRFTEMGIHTPDGWSFCRLALDMHSLAVFSTQGDFVQKRQTLMQQGHSYQEAINILVENGEVV